MASVQEISPRNLGAFIKLIPEILQEKALKEPFHFYGIEESGEASGVIVFKDSKEIAEIMYIYILPYLRGTGVVDVVLSDFFVQLDSAGYSFATMQFVPNEYPVLSHISKRFGFEESRLDYAYFRFTAQDVLRCRASSFEPQGIIRVRYLPPDKLERLKKLVDKYIKVYGDKLLDIKEALPYSMVYLEGTEPKGTLIVDVPQFDEDATVGDMKRYPEPGAYDITLFFVGTTSQKAPLYLLSGLCRILEKELPPNAIITSYIPEGHVVTLFENILGIKGYHEVLAKLDLGGL